MKKTLKFHADAFYTNPQVPMFRNGQIVELEDNLGFATRWIKRGLATQVQGLSSIPSDPESPELKVDKEGQGTIEIPEETKQDTIKMKSNNKFNRSRNRNPGLDSL